MNKYYHKHISLWEKRKLESLNGNKPILKQLFGTTDHGWDIINWEWFVNVDEIVFCLKTEQKNN